MYTEIEAKLKVDSLEEVRKKLKELGAEFAGELLQEDELFDDYSDSLTKADSCIRLRKQSTDRETKYILTYKGEKEKSGLKKRLEIEVEVSDGKSVQNILSALGYEKKITVEKRRVLWRLGGCEVALDQLKQLGNFVEIEGPDEKVINDVQKSLGLENLLHIPESYASLIADKLTEMRKQG